MTGRHRLLVFAVAGSLLLAAPASLARADAANDLAEAARLQTLERYAASESLASTALQRLEGQASTDSLAMAEAFHLIGTARWRTVGYADGSGLRAASRSLGIRARRLPADHLDLAESHALVARFLPETGRPDSAQFHVRRALAIRTDRVGAQDTLVAKTWDQLALIQRNSGDMRGCLDSWTRAIAIREQVHGPDHPEVARLLGQTGVPWMELGDLDKAREVLEESLRRFARSDPGHPGRWIPLNILADVEKRLGNGTRNYDLLQEAFAVVRTHYGESSREALTVRGNLGIALFELGDHEGARAYYEALLPLLEAQYGPAHVRTLTTVHGLSLARRWVGDYTGALRLMQGIDSVLSARPGPPPELLSRVQSQMADVLYWLLRDSEARATSERALRTAQALRNSSGNALAGAYLSLIPTLVAIGDSTALDSARRGLLEVDRRYALGVAALTPIIQLNAAWASHHLGREDEAWEHALEGDRIARDRQRLSNQSLPDRRALLLARVEMRNLDVVLDLSSADPARRETAWDRLVRSRGLVWSEIARRRRPPGLESDTAIAGLQERWVVAQRRWARRLVSTGTRRDSAAQVALEGLQAVAEESEAAYARALAPHGSIVPAAEVGLADVRSRLRPGQALVGCVQLSYYFRGAPQRMIAFVARGGSDAIERIDLGTSDALRAALDPWRQRLAAPGLPEREGRAERECFRLGRIARAATWDRIAPHLSGVTDVFLVEDGPLVEVPWHALPDGSRGYLVEAGPRLHRLHAERDLVEQGSAAPSRSLLALGAPDYDRLAPDDPGSPAMAAALVRSAPDPCVDGALPVFAPLPGSGAEVEAVARTWRSTAGHEATVLTGGRASERAFKREAGGQAIVHLATHGMVAGDRCATGDASRRGVGGLDPFAMASTTPAVMKRKKAVKTPPPSIEARQPSPWMSRRVWLALAGANRARESSLEDDDGFLTAEEVLTLDLEGTDWVVLSACHSGLAEAWSREGALGMRRAFDLAGARTVIASQWEVDDDDAAEWMQALYAARAGGATSASAAMESASRVVLAARRKAGRPTHPFHWAAFSATGE